MFKSIISVALVANSLVLVSSTAPVIRCYEGEVYVECPDMSKPVNCSQLGHSLPVPEPGPGCPTKPACLCGRGFLRNDEGVCIPIDKCPACGDDPNAKPGCGFSFGKRCSRNGPVPGSGPCGINACECKPGYVYDDNTGQCVLPKHCTPVCGVNEVYSECMNGGCFGARHCYQLGARTKCFLPKYCIKGCLCKKGYLRNANRKCVPENQCCDYKNHEVYSNCINGGCIGERKCSERGRPEKCYTIDPLTCKKGCICQKGYLRAKNGVCVPRHKCPRKCEKPNEVFEECPGTCPARTCGIDDRLVSCGKPLKVGDPNCPLPACRCASGFFRTPKGDCVKWEKCPPPPCGRNEVYSKCPDSSQPRDCSQLGFPLPAPVPSPDGSCPTKPGCICAKGYVRNSKGVCIPMNRCPSCGGDPNAKCGTHFGRRCSNYHTGPVLFPQVCNKNACNCKPGFAYDENIKKCVLPEDCTPVCGVNEKYVTCPSYSWPYNCSQLGYEMPLIAPTPDGKCPTKPGCICLDGHVRDENGVCIPIDKCPPRNNEMYSTCVEAECRAIYCIEKDDPVYCPFVKHRNCTEGYVCRPGYYRTYNGTCVHEDECDESK